jgi:hypothetical protein
LQRAKAKLPTWFAQRCILLQTPLEQCTSEAAAALKPALSGGHLLDLTCGLGVDAWHWSSTFESVTTLEQDAGLATLARHNLERLGRPHVQVLHQRAEDFLAQHTHPRWDVIYVDPARREGGGQRRFLLQDCSPDVLALRQRLTQLAPQVWVKVSPLFDISEGLRLLAPVSEVRVIAVEGEVKEVLFCMMPEAPLRVNRVAAWQRKGIRHQFIATDETPSMPLANQPESAFVLEPDVSLYKAGLEREYMQSVAPTATCAVQGGYFFADEGPAAFAGDLYQVLERMPYQPGKVTKRLRELGLERVNLTRRAFDVPLPQVREALRVREGGDDFLLLTRDERGARWALLAKRVVNF